MDSQKKLFNNTLLLTFGYLGSRIIILLMIPFYSHVMTQGELGTVDLFMAALPFLNPLMTFSLGQTMIRFLLRTNDEIVKKNIFSTSMIFVLAMCVIIVLLFIPVYLSQEHFGIMHILFILLLILNCCQLMLADFVKGNDKLKQLAVNGIMMAFVTAMANIILLVVLEIGIIGALISLIIANMLSILYFLFCLKLMKYFIFMAWDSKLLKEMLRYSTPLIPSTMIWWLKNNVVSRFLILVMIGTAGNGIFAIASKFPAMMSLFTSTFNQAWQISAFNDDELGDKDEHYSSIFNQYYKFLVLIGSGVFVISRLFVYLFINHDFYASWFVTPPLIFATIFKNLAFYVGIIYGKALKTIGAFWTSFVGVFVAVGLNFVLLTWLGIIGAAIGNAIAFLIVLILRLRHTRQFVQIKIDKPKFILNFLFLLGQWGVMVATRDINVLIAFGIQIFIFVILVIMNKELVKLILKMVKRKLKRA